MDANAKAITRARQIAKDYINRVGDWYDAKAISRAIEYMEEIYNLPDDPPRNCDRFATVDEARKAHEAVCEKYGKCHNGCPLNNEEHYSAFDCFEAWLFAPATEQEGGAK